jgi:hypothetical protein
MGRFKPGQELELSVADGRLEIEHPVTPMRLERRGGRLVAVTGSSDVHAHVRARAKTLEQTRR